MNKTPSFELGTSTVPAGISGPWTLEDYEVSEQEASFHNLRCAINGRGTQAIAAGRYRCLRHARRGIVMSNTPMEIRTNRHALHRATGRVLINGLGMGMLLEAIQSKPCVTHVTVVERDADVIALVGPHFANDPRVRIVNACAFDYKPAKGERFDFVWHDIWDDISAENLPQMSRLVRKYARRAQCQGVWSREMIRTEQARRRQRRFG